MLHLGVRPIAAAVWSLAPMLLAVVSFVALVVNGFGLGEATRYTTGGLLAVFVIFVLRKSSYGSLAGILAGWIVLLRFNETGDVNYPLTWTLISLALAYMTATAFAEREGKETLLAKFLFELTLYQGFFWSVFLVRLTYTPGDWIRAYGFTLLGLVFTAGILLWWAQKARGTKYRVAKAATA